MEFRTLKLRRDPACPVCGDHPTITALIDYEQFCGITPAGAGGEHGRRCRAEFETTVEELKARLDRGDARRGFSTCASRASTTSAGFRARR